MEHCRQQNTPPSPDQNATPPTQYPCAACKSLRRRCSDKCVLAPYFPSSEPLRFNIVHKVYGASNIIRRLQELPEHQRSDAMKSMVYEAAARIRDPVYGCAGTVTLLQQQILGLQEELAKAQAEILNMQCQIANLVSLNWMEMFPWQEQETINVSGLQQDIIHISEKQPWDDSDTTNFSLEQLCTHEKAMGI
ncbi:LOB domain-containing protein 1-like [Coffea arabica]|uniref:LOB domain-containing protein 1-like n=1 Tax=Coffea arabica TaxID=13443 RepID=A0ABM4VQW0_COFAR